MREGGVAASEIKCGAEVGLVAYSGALKRAGPLPKVSGFIKAVTSDCGRPTVGSGNGGDKGSLQGGWDAYYNICFATKTMAMNIKRTVEQRIVE